MRRHIYLKENTKEKKKRTFLSLTTIKKDKMKDQIASFVL